MRSRFGARRKPGAVFLFATAAISACSTSRVVLDDREFAAHSAVDFESVRFRRPATPVYDFEAAKPVVEGPRPLGTLDCERSEDFFGGLDLAAIRGCLAGVARPAPGAETRTLELEWGLRKDGQPVLELRDVEDAPECIRATLGSIPFPRELVYVVPTENPDRGECYTSRLALDSGELLGWELPRARIRLRVGFPLRTPPATDREVERLLRSWTLSLYRGGAREKGGFHGRFLPTRYCLRCLGLPEVSERGAATLVPPPLSLWPSRGGGESVRWESESRL